MIDTHCHLTDPRLFDQLEVVLTRARSAGVDRMIAIGTGLQDDRAAVAVCQGRDFLRCAVGVHPGYVQQVEPSDLPQLREIATDASAIAIGEMGLDYHYGKENRQRQIDYFAFQLQLATELNRAAVIHSREATDDCLAVMKDFPAVRAVFHCYTGTAAEAGRVLDAGFLIGFTGVVTFKNPGEIPQVVANTPLDRLLVETDAPYLSPEPLRRQKVCEPAFVMHTAAKVAEIKNISLQELDRYVTENARGLFSWPLTDAF